MGLIKSKGNMYTWVTDEWNPVKGKCYHDCSYCYMKRWGKQNPVRLDEKEFKTDLEFGRVIFVVSGSDLFAKDIPDEWIYKTLNYASRFKNSYLFQSKNPSRMYEFIDYMGYLDRVCTTIETNRIYPDIMGNTPSPADRALGLSKFPFNRYLTIEPILDFDFNELVDLVKLCNPVQVNIGADSGNNHLNEPSKEKILELINELQKFTIIDQKRNLNRLLKP